MDRSRGKRRPQPEHRPVPHRLHDGGALASLPGPPTQRSTLRCECAQRRTSDFLSTHADDRVAGGGGPVAEFRSPTRSRARWLQACLWPSQPERHARMAAAIAIAQAHPQRIIGADAVDGVAQALAEAPADTALVITTTWVWCYLPEATQAGSAGTRSRDSGRRVRWYSLEGRGVVAELGQPTEREVIDSLIGRVELGGGTPDTSEVLGLSHPHGAWLDWYAGHRPSRSRRGNAQQTPGPQPEWRGTGESGGMCRCRQFGSVSWAGEVLKTSPSAPSEASAPLASSGMKIFVA